MLLTIASCAFANFSIPPQLVAANATRSSLGAESKEPIIYNSDADNAINTTTNFKTMPTLKKENKQAKTLQ